MRGSGRLTPSKSSQTASSSCPYGYLSATPQSVQFIQSLRIKESNVCRSRSGENNNTFDRYRKHNHDRDVAGRKLDEMTSKDLQKSEVGVQFPPIISRQLSTNAVQDTSRGFQSKASRRPHAVGNPEWWDRWSLLMLYSLTKFTMSHFRGQPFMLLDLNPNTCLRWYLLLSSPLQNREDRPSNWLWPLQCPVVKSTNSIRQIDTIPCFSQREKQIQCYTQTVRSSRKNRTRPTSL